MYKRVSFEKLSITYNCYLVTITLTTNMGSFRSANFRTVTKLEETKFARFLYY